MESVWERHAEAFARHAEGSAYNALYERPAMLELILARSLPEGASTVRGEGSSA